MRALLATLIAALTALTLWTAVVPGQGAVWAQQTAGLSAESYADWEKVAARAEEALANARASNTALEALRVQLVEWRTRFHAEQARDADGLRTLKSQIDSLGPAPAEGETESEELAARRSQLTNDYQQRITPVRRAEEAYARAEGLIQRIDRLIRERQKDKLLRRAQSPLNPNSAIGAFSDMRMVGRILSTEINSSIHLEASRVKFRDNLPGIVVLLAMAALLLARGRPWFKRLVDWTIRSGGGSDRAMVVAMVVSVGQVLLPSIGLILLTAAVQATGLLGAEGERLLYVLPSMGIAFFGARWLGGQTFPRNSEWPTTLELTARERVRGRFYSSSLGLLFAVAILVQQVVDLFPLEESTTAVMAFPVIVLAALCLAGLARLLISHGGTDGSAISHHQTSDGIDERSFLDRTLLLIGRAGLFFAIAGPVLAIVGYTRAAVFFSLSPALSLGLLAMVSFFQRLSMHLFRLFSPQGKDPSQGLLPVLINFALLTAALPLFVMIWGVRRADLIELWNNLQEGVRIGDTQISLSVLIAFAAVFGVGMLLTRLVQTAMRASVLPRTRIDPGGQKAMVSGLGYLGVMISAMVAVSVAGLDLSNLAIVAGALSVGVGFGLQNIVSNFVSGLILLIERPVTEGDWIEVGGVMGTVRKISVRATTVETFDRTDVIVPNSDLVSGHVTNWTRGNLTGRLILPVGVAYGTDTRKVAAILQEIAEAHPLVIVNPPPLIVFQGFGADSLDFEIRVILRDINFGLGTRTELNHQIAARFKAEGIEIPFAQRDVWLRNPEAFAPASGPVPEPVIDRPSPDSQPEFPTEDET